MNLLDLAFVALTLIFVITAFFRGFVKEIFSLFNWLLALTLSYLLTPYLSKFIAAYSSNKLVADISARSLIFIAVFFITAISTAGLCKALKEKMPEGFDRSLGVLYGLIKTLLIFGFVYSLAFNLYGFLVGKKSDEVLLNQQPARQEPTWLKEAKCHDILKFSGTALDPLVKVFFDAITKNFDQVMPKQKNLDEKIDEVLGEKKETSNSPSNELDQALEGSGYNKKDIEKMNRLIEIIGNK